MYLQLVIILVLLSIVYWLSWRWTHRKLLKLSALMPGPPTLPVLGNALVFMSKPNEQLEILTDMLLCYNYGPYVRFWLGPELNVIILDPSDIRHILTCGKVNQKGPLYKYMELFLGPGILTGGSSWRYNRKLVNMSFSKKFMYNFTEVFNKEAIVLADLLSKKDPGLTFNVYLDVVMSTTQCVCQTVMGLTKEDSENIKCLEEATLKTHSMYEFVFTNMTHWWFRIPPIYWLCGRKKVENHYSMLVGEVASDILAKRRKIINDGQIDEESVCVVDRLIAGGLRERELIEEIFTLFTASQEASAKIAATVLLILAYLPEWQEKVYNEIVEFIGPNDEFVTESHMKLLQNLDLVYKEAVRLMPIGAFIQRTVEEDVSINNGKYTLPAGTSVIIPVMTLHRDPSHWVEPDKAMPERFLPENSRTRNPNAYIPFSVGAMDCLGRVYATSMIKTMVVHILRKVIVSAEGKFEDLELNVAISAKFAKGYNLSVRPRKTRT